MRGGLEIAVAREMSRVPLPTEVVQRLAAVSLLPAGSRQWSDEGDGLREYEDDGDGGVDRDSGLESAAVLGSADEALLEGCQQGSLLGGLRVAMGACGWPVLDALPGSPGLHGSATALLILAPPEFRCAMDGSLCRSPCRSPAGALFERRTVEAWLRHVSCCPISGVPMSAQELVDDIAISQAIAAWIDSTAAHL